MNWINQLKHQFQPSNEPEYAPYVDYLDGVGLDSYPGGPFPSPDGGGGMWQFEQLAGEISAEALATVAFVGLSGAGKSTLFNQLRGWSISPVQAVPHGVENEVDHRRGLERYGAFTLVDLLEQPDEDALDQARFILNETSLVVYVLNIQQAVGGDDYRWIAFCKALGKSVLVVVNHCDAIGSDLPHRLEVAEQRLGCRIIPISAHTGEGIESHLLPALLDAAPKLAMVLGRELRALRKPAARRLIRQAALFSMLTSSQPMPFIDIPLQAAVHAGVVMRVAATYGKPMTGGVSRELCLSVVLSLLIHVALQNTIRFVPVLGWLAAGGLGGLAALGVGELALYYFELTNSTTEKNDQSSRSDARRTFFNRDRLRLISPKGEKGGKNDESN